MFEYTWFHIAPWGHELVLYFTLIGAVAMTYILAAIPSFSAGGQALAATQRPALIVAFAGLVLCGPLLITDLGQPGRFFNILIYGHGSSPLVWGSYLLILFGLCAAAMLYATFIKPNPTLQRWAALAGSVLAVGFPLYTGLDLAANQGRALWHDPLIPLLFISLSATSGMAIVAVLGQVTGASKNEGLFRVLGNVLKWASLATSLMVLLLVIRLSYGSAEEMQALGIIQSEMGFGFWVMGFLLGGIVPLVLTLVPTLRGNSVALTVGGVLGLIGAYTLREVILTAGQLPQLFY